MGATAVDLNDGWIESLRLEFFCYVHPDGAASDDQDVPDHVPWFARQDKKFVDVLPHRDDVGSLVWFENVVTARNAKALTAAYRCDERGRRKRPAEHGQGLRAQRASRRSKAVPRARVVRRRVAALRRCLQTSAGGQSVALPHARDLPGAIGPSLAPINLTGRADTRLREPEQPFAP